MEQFVLGIFQEQLSKFIIGFRKEQVNANLLNGKGEIHNVELNCAFLNETTSRISPFIEFDRVHVSKLSFHVSSWANLRKSPIIIDVEHVTASVVEPLHFLDRSKRRRLRQIMKSELIQLVQQGLVPTRGPYNLFDRILDNITVEIESVHISFQPWGKFKTRRVGPWTPPQLQVTLASVRLSSVNEYGQEASAEEVWKHNHHRRESLFIYKKLEMEYQVSLRAQDGSYPIPLVSGCDNKMEVQLAIHRRVRDGEILAVQVDATIPKAEVDIPTKVVPVLAHALAGLTYCFCKDRAFTDPLKPDGNQPPSNEPKTKDAELEIITTSADETGSVESDSNASGQSQPQQLQGQALPILPEAVEVFSDDEDDEVEIGDDHSTEAIGVEQALAVETFLEKNRQVHEELSPATPAKHPTANASHSTQTFAAHDQPGFKDRPIILLPTGIAVHEKLTFSISVHHATVRGTYAEESQGGNGYIQFTSRGVIAELIWPKVTEEKGGYFQASVSYISVQERYGARVRTIMLGGAQHDLTGPIEKPTERRTEIGPDESFPLYENRSIRPDPLSLRYTFPVQAFGVKSTISFQKKLASAADSNEEELHVLHEVGTDRFEIVLDSQSWCRAIRFALNENDGGFDPRWHSGDWSDRLSPKMLISPSHLLNLDECVQSSPQIFLDENELPSSDLFNVTARLTHVDLRIPAALADDVRSCDIILKMDEAMLIISSALPRTFLSGKIGSSVNGENVKKKGLIEFPNDPSDLVYALERLEDPSNRQRGVLTSRAISTFRLQLTIRGAAVRLQPAISVGKSHQSQELLAPSELTMIICFEGEPINSEESFLTKVVLFTSVQAHRFDINIDFDLLSAAIGVMVHHATLVRVTLSACGNISRDVDDAERSLDVDTADGRIKRSLGGRHVLVKKQIHNSRESGGLSLAFCFQAASIRLSLWRQNVPFSGIFNHSRRENIDESHRNGSMPLVLLMRFDVVGIETGVEATLLRDHRHVVLKACLAGISFCSCDFPRFTGNDRLGAGQDNSQHQDEPLERETGSSDTTGHVGLDLASIFELGNFSADEYYSVDPLMLESNLALRLEEKLENSRTWLFSADLGKGATLNCNIDAIEALILLIMEALSMPAWVKHDTLPRIDGAWSFPVGTVGELFLSLSSLLSPNDKKTVFEDINELVTSQIPGGMIDHLLRRLIDKLVPEDVCLILLRFDGCDLLVKIPVQSDAESDFFGILIERAELLASYRSLHGSTPDDIMKHPAKEGASWSSIIQSEERGLQHSLLLRQRLIRSASNTDDNCHSTLVEPFELSYAYAKSRVRIFPSNSLVVNSVGGLDAFLGCMKRFAKRSQEISATISRVFSIVKDSQRSDSTAEASNNEPKRIPIGMACISAANSIRLARESLRLASETFAEQCLTFESNLEEKDRELDRLRRTIFRKERERIAAISLVSSQVTGWLRIGSSQRIGQRGIMSWNLFPRWSILRNGLLLTYSAPGEYTPLDTISIKGASLRQLEGGRRKRDLKRSFAIVESTGVVHLVIAGSDHEYYKWVRELKRATGVTEESTSPEEADDSIDSCSSVCSDSETKALSATNHGRAVGRSLTRAVQAARATGQAVIELSRRNQTYENPPKEDAERSRGHANLTGINLDDASTKNEEQVVSTSNEQSKPDTVQSLEDDSVHSPNTRQLLRSKFAGVSQVTRNRFGSALQAAKERGLNVANSTRLRIGQNNSLGNERHTLIDDEGGVSCPACTFINKHSARACEICNTSLQNLLTASSSKELDDRMECHSQLNPARVLEANDGQIDSFEPASVDDPRENKLLTTRLSKEEDIGRREFSDQMEGLIERVDVTPRKGMKERLGAAVRSVRVGGFARDGLPDQSGMVSLRLRADQNLESLGTLNYGVPEKTRLRDVMLGGHVVDPSYPIARRETESPPVVLKRLKGSLITRVSNVFFEVANFDVAVETPPSSQGGDILSRRPSSAPLPKKNIEDMTDQEPISQSIKPGPTESSTYVETSNVPASLPVEMNSGSSGLSTVSGNLTKTSNILANLEAKERNPAQPEQGMQAEVALPRCTDFKSAGRSLIEATFRIQVCDGNSLTQPTGLEAKTEVTKTLTEILVLHTQLSESIATVANAAVDYRFEERNGNLEINPNHAKGLGLSTLETVSITGKILEGLLQHRPGENAEAFKKHCAETISAFFNAALDCALPVDGLAALVDFLRLKEASSDPVDEVRTPPNSHAASGLDNDGQQGQYLSLCASAAARLVRAESQVLLAERIAGEDVKSPGHPILGGPVILAPQVSYHFRESMHNALMSVMEERDEAHARLIAAGVLHIHEMEQQRKTINRLAQELSEAKLLTPNATSKVDDKLRRSNIIQDMQQDSEAELLSLCQQLASEIAARTSAGLEILRLKEGRKIEREQEASERLALEAELEKTRELLAAERARYAESCAESKRWRQSYQKVVEMHENSSESALEPKRDD